MKNLTIIVLAAGKGTRMNSSVPKVFQPIGGIPLIEHTLNSAKKLNPKEIFLILNKDISKENFKNEKLVHCFYQKKQLGTADAVKACLSKLKKSKNKVLIMYADVPFIDSRTLRNVINLKSPKEIKLLTFKKEEYNSYGKIILGTDGFVNEIIEQRELSSKDRYILCNSGVFCSNAKVFSFYNETNGEGIYPTPAIGGVGLIKDLSNTMTIALKKEGSYICVIGKNNNHIGNSQYLSIIKNKEIGSTPSIDLNEELKNGKFVLNCIEKNKFEAVHDIADGGLLIALAEMSIYGKKGVKIDVDKSSLIEYLFGEDQSRYLVEISKNNVEDIMSEAEKNNVFVEKIGLTQADQFEIKNIGKIQVKELILAHESWFKKFTN